MIVGTESPVILGWDIAGTVAAIGGNVTQFELGDSVFGMVNFPAHGKCYAEWVAAPENHLAKTPADTSFEDAAATTLAALTALQVLRPRIKVGDRVLIHAGSGGIGHFAIQIAKHLGAYVLATSSEKTGIS
ncbi:MAG: NADPH:quinone reductase-like Zn-dependent oxidoreductase [Candidatus Latescibacterota bacterium]|jgi:NADPH:quinone reductase-like Zn-dependent oxidoreductase